MHDLRDAHNNISYFVIIFVDKPEIFKFSIIYFLKNRYIFITIAVLFKAFQDLFSHKEKSRSKIKRLP